MDFTQCLVLKSDLKIVFFLHWAVACLGVSREQVESLHVAEDRDTTFYSVVGQ